MLFDLSQSDGGQTLGRGVACGPRETFPRLPVTDQTLGESERQAGPPDDEAWIVAANSELKIRVRSLTLYLKRGGSLNDIRLVEGADGIWTLWVRLKNRPGEFRVNQFKSDRPRTYKDVALAVACCREDFGYTGPITLVTDRLPGGPGGPAATAADRNFNSAHE